MVVRAQILKLLCQVASIIRTSSRQLQPPALAVPSERFSVAQSLKVVSWLRDQILSNWLALLHCRPMVTQLRKIAIIFMQSCSFWSKVCFSYRGRAQVANDLRHKEALLSEWATVLEDWRT